MEAENNKNQVLPLIDLSKGDPFNERNIYNTIGRVSTAIAIQETEMRNLSLLEIAKITLLMLAARIEYEAHTLVPGSLNRFLATNAIVPSLNEMSRVISVYSIIVKQDGKPALPIKLSLAASDLGILWHPTSNTVAVHFAALLSQMWPFPVEKKSLSFTFDVPETQTVLTYFITSWKRWMDRLEMRGGSHSSGLAFDVQYVLQPPTDVAEQFFPPLATYASAIKIARTFIGQKPSKEKAFYQALSSFSDTFVMYQMRESLNNRAQSIRRCTLAYGAFSASMRIALNIATQMQKMYNESSSLKPLLPEQVMIHFEADHIHVTARPTDVKLVREFLRLKRNQTKDVNEAQIIDLANGFNNILISYSRDTKKMSRIPAHASVTVSEATGVFITALKKIFSSPFQ
jgi:hypothetical protein